MEKKWHILEAPEEKVTSLHQALHIHPVLCKILIQRGIETFAEAKHYFRPELAGLHDPFLMKGMNIAVERLIAAFEKEESILVFGDYDVDGTTAVSCMLRFLQKVYRPEKVRFYIPHRYREGYGVSKAGIDFALTNGISLIVSLDCGIKSVELIRYAKENDVDFIVCDHHLPDQELPPAVAILNPKQEGCSYPYKELCGCGVGFKLISALCKRLGLADTASFEYLDLVATATAADIVPMTGENRLLAYYGLKKVNENPAPGIKALMELSGVQKGRIHINELVFVIAPRINAAGRMDDASKVVQLFIEEDYSKALEYAALLHSDNHDRKEADSSITEQALHILENDSLYASRKTTVVYQPHWHKGVVGIVASRLIEKYYRPTVVLTRSDDVLAGSARSVAGFNLYEAIHGCREHLLGYGGHFAAAGLTLLPDNLENFSRQFEEVVSRQIEPEQLVPEIVIDAVIDLPVIKPAFYNIVCQMEPYGPDNLRPVFLCRGAIDTGYSKIVKEQHIKFSIRQHNTMITGIGFNMADRMDMLGSGKPVDIVFTLSENEWNGEKSLQIKVIDFRPSSA
ncbi:MAG: single-stranded-DNA-specific exonuclease RecJ [Chitinophagaceae bacterium]|nr:single-stranded-DNA-specific exonuclease RecJ [Chitinophagaceae bacterium]